MLNMIAPFEMGICVDNLDTMIAFYRDILGFELISEIDVLADRSTKAGFTVGGYRIVRMQTHYGERIKLVQPAHPSQGCHQNDARATGMAGQVRTLRLDALNAAGQ